MVIGLGIYLLVYKADILSVIFQKPHMYAATVIIIFCGSFILVMAFVGLCSASLKHKHLLLMVGIGTLWKWLIFTRSKSGSVVAQIFARPGCDLIDDIFIY